MATTIPATRRYELFIGGEWQAAASGETFDRENPATGEPIGAFPRGDRGDADRAVAAALATHRSRAWSDLPGAEKQRRLRSLADTSRLQTGSRVRSPRA